MSSDQRPGTRYTLRLDEDLMEELRLAAKASGKTMREFLEDAIREHVRVDLTTRTETAVAPILAELLATNLKGHSASLRKMMVRLAYEVFRQQYLLCEFLVRAGMEPSEVEQWREDGWKWAIRALKQQPEEDAGA